jgi:cell division protein FtsA
VNRKDIVPLHEFDPSATGEVTRRFLAEIIEVRLEEIMELVKAELKAAGRNFEFPGGAVLVGGGVKLPGVAEFVKAELKTPVQIGIPYLHEFAVGDPAHRELLEDPRAATVVGLVLWSNAERERLPLPKNPIAKLLRYLIP